jgi:hypothetical protein
LNERRLAHEPTKRLASIAAAVFAPGLVGGGMEIGFDHFSDKLGERSLRVPT